MFLLQLILLDETIDQLNDLGWDKAAQESPIIKTYLKTHMRSNNDPFDSKDIQHYTLVSEFATDDLHEAFSVSNEYGKVKETKFALRRTSGKVGDIFVIYNEDTGFEFHLVKSIGFEKIELSSVDKDFVLNAMLRMTIS